MCQSVFAVGEDQEHLGTAGKLAAWLGCQPEELVMLDGIPEDVPDFFDWRDACLCGVDIPATLDKFYIWHRRDVDGDPMRYLAMKL